MAARADDSSTSLSQYKWDLQDPATDRPTHEPQA
jgi:hypothetical protein